MARPKKQAEQPKDEAVNEWIEATPGPCARCGHATIQHATADTACNVLECDCVSFVYPPDDQGQMHLPGEEFVPTPAQQELYPLIRNLNRIRTERLQANKDETDAQAAVLKVMHAHNIESITVDGKYWVRVPGKEKVKTSDKDGAEEKLELDE